MQLKLQKYAGKYFDYFESKEMASRYIKNLALYYREHKDRISVAELIRKERNKGIKINYVTLTKYFEQLGVDYQSKVSKRKRVAKYQSYNFENDVIDSLRTLPNQTRFLEFMVRVAFSLPTEDVMLFLDDNVKVYIYKESELNAVVLGPIEKRDENMIRGLIKSAKVEGLPVIKKFAQTFNYRILGGKI